MTYKQKTDLPDTQTASAYYTMNNELCILFFVKGQDCPEDENMVI